MKTSHTPGPWHIGKETRIIGANSQRVAVCDNNEAVPGYANAVLIAAAPETATERDKLRKVNADLLTALESMVKAGEYQFSVSGWPAYFHNGSLARARAAIAKARGR